MHEALRRGVSQKILQGRDPYPSVCALALGLSAQLASFYHELIAFVLTTKGRS
jgi:hypothetical protein